ncbi:unnamed protein product [Zymoseptoria tritici ST99CH_3D1]|uniref:NADPH-dependent FMN reductase-like domain-containing protein n=2 Tax=Zymoseptoria tritici TaxID=1047171 RepID=F9XIF5_ZYMTI|nr:uncharacterized protein MYCGRDRAFT_45855 [Zymoseptoria tritici IPO323]EGP85464.1 hypothetical protein MYCGRDRAFT_45855 [Zymoseptoria tritici IPO323]SMR59564.1 unnamed protein product [Zymoseptoria tritici ST99CH_3D1]
MVTIALIAGSTRSPRLGPGIARYVHNIATEHAKSKAMDVKVDILDLAEQSLSFYDEPGIPSHIPKDDPVPHYVHDHTKAWSKKIRQYQGFIFVTPQYNWSVPAGLKNALDYLCHEWTDKPGAIVSYGGHGGDKAAAHLRDIMNGLRMKPVSMDANLRITKSLVETFFEDGTLEDEMVRQWREEGVEQRIQQGLEEVVKELQ